MNKRSTLILGPAELDGLWREYPDRILQSECIALTPYVYEYALSNPRFHNIKYPKWVQGISTFSMHDYHKIESYLIELEDTSDQLRQELFIEKSTKVDWNYQSNFLLALMIVSARSFATQAKAHLASFQHVDIVALNHAGEFYFDSCLQSVVLCHELQRLGITASLLLLDERAKAATYIPELYESIPNLFSNKFSQDWQSVKRSVLVATSAIYLKDDQQKLGLVLKGAYSDSVPIIYPLPLWSVINSSKEFSDQCTIAQALNQLSDDEKSKCLFYSDWLTSTTENILITIFEDESLRANPLFKAQVNRLHKRHLLQTLTFIGWRNAFKIQSPQMLALTVQDSSINGPLASAAKIFNIDVIVFPHSHIVNWRTPCECIVATEWWQPKEAKTLWGEENQSIYFDMPVYSKEDGSSNAKSSNWMILYNGVQRNLASSVAWPFMQQVVNLIQQLAKKAGANLTHRLKPGDQTPFNTFCNLLEIDKTSTTETLKAPLQDLLKSTDLVLSIDDPSSALWQALSSSCAVVLVTDRPLPKESMADGEILCAMNLIEFTKLLESFIHEPGALEKFRLQQQEKFLNLRSQRIKV